MFSKHRYTVRPAWLWFLVVVGVLVLLSACASGSTASAGAPSTPTVIMNTPTATQPPPTPTVTHVPAAPKQGTQIVLITDESNGSFGFSPDSLTIMVGSKVIWKNMSSAPHTVTTDDGQTADSGTLPVGGSFSFTFTTAGTFPYHCNIHPYMRATIIVVPARK